MSNKKPTFRKLTPTFGSSILVKQHIETIDKDGAYWHFHPELEDNNLIFETHDYLINILRLGCNRHHNAKA